MLDSFRTYLEISKKKPGTAYIGLVHRLDRPCSGVVVFAKTSKAASRLGESFRNRTVDKHYVCMVNRSLQGTGVLSHSIMKSSTSKVRILADDSSKHRGVALSAKLCYTQLKSILLDRGKQNFDDRAYQTLLHIKLETGRKHQIRAQLKAIGHPIVGDIKYGAPQSFRDRSIALHACSLVIEHPISHERMRFSAPPPATWKARFGSTIMDSIDHLIRSFPDIENNIAQKDEA